MALSAGITISISLLISFLYVAVLHIKIPEGRMNRNDPVVIRRRLTAITIFTVFTIIALPLVLSWLTGKSGSEIFGEMGVIPSSAKDIFNTLLLMMALFIGPILNDVVETGDALYTLKLFVDHFTTLRGIRDVVIAPLTEEVLYTAAIITTLSQSPYTSSDKILIMLPPLFFSLAHVHHGIELYINRAAPVPTIVLSTAFQVLYTLLFGIFTDFVFLRQRNVWGCIVAHSFCNHMGVPSISVDTPRWKSWRYIYYCLLALGAYLFKELLYPLTQSEYTEA